MTDAIGTTHTLLLSSVIADTLAGGGIILLIISIAWLAHREITKSRSKASAAERQLHTERNRLEERVSARTRELIASEEARMRELERVTRLGELSKGLFHDLMSPLTSISLNLEQLANGSVPAREAEDMVKKTVAASARMRSFMESVRSVLGAGPSAPVEAVSTDLSSELSITCDLLAYKARTAGVTLIAKRAPHVVVRAHPVRMEQLLLNIVSNAIESCERRLAITARAAAAHGEIYAPTVSISIDRVGSDATIEVVDGGTGISPDMAHKLFVEQFTTRPGGTGIGLLTVSSIVRELGGMIELTNIPDGSGAVCRVRLPSL